MADAASSRGKEAVRTWLRMLSCEAVIKQRLRSLFRTNFSITLPQFDVLAELERAGNPLTMSELSRQLMVSSGNVTGVIDRLERNGFVERNRAEHDRRVQYICLTKDGHRKFDRMAKHHERWITDLFADLNASDLTHLQSLLLKARRSASAAAISAE